MTPADRLMLAKLVALVAAMALAIWLDSRTPDDQPPGAL